MDIHDSRRLSVSDISRTFRSTPELKKYGLISGGRRFVSIWHAGLDSCCSSMHHVWTEPKPGPFSGGRRFVSIWHAGCLAFTCLSSILSSITWPPRGQGAKACFHWSPLLISRFAQGSASMVPRFPLNIHPFTWLSILTNLLYIMKSN